MLIQYLYSYNYSNTIFDQLKYNFKYEVVTGLIAGCNLPVVKQEEQMTLFSTAIMEITSFDRRYETIEIVNCQNQL